MKNFKQIMKMTIAGILCCTIALSMMSFSMLNLDPPGKIQFTAKNDKMTANGSFESWKIVSSEMPDGKIENIKVIIEVDLNSVNSGKGMLNSHLKKSDFFHTKKYSTCTVTIDGATKAGEVYNTSMMLDMTGMKKTIPATFTVESMTPFKVKGKANYERKMHGIGKDKEGAYFNLEPNVALEFEATIPNVTVSRSTPTQIADKTGNKDGKKSNNPLSLENSKKKVKMPGDKPVKITSGTNEQSSKTAPIKSFEEDGIWFTTKNDKLDAKGTFDKWEITSFEMADNNIENIKARIEVDMNSVNTGIEKLDAHLKAADFFNTAKYPQAIIRIDGATRQGRTANIYKSVMKVDINGQKADLPVQFQVISKKPFRVNGTAEIARASHGIGETTPGAYYNLLPNVNINFVATMPDPVKDFINFTAINDKITAEGSFDNWVIKSYSMKDGLVENIKTTLEIDLNSVKTGMDKLDEHLKAADFFNTSNYPKCTVTIDGAERKGRTPNIYTTTMVLEMNGTQSKLPCDFAVISKKPFRVAGKAVYARAGNNIGDATPGAYYNLQPEVNIAFEATMPSPPPGTITFKAKNDKIEAVGNFGQWEVVRFTMPKGDIESMQAMIKVDLSSVSTGMAKLDAHLQADDFFNVAKQQYATILLSGAERSGRTANRYKTTMVLDLNGKKSQLPCEFEVVSTNPLKVKGKAEFDRTANGVGDAFPAYYNLLNNVVIEFDAEMPK